MRSAAPDPEPRGLATAWAILCAVALGLVFASSLVWIDHNPAPIDWDNAEYLNMVTEDHHAYRRDGLIGALRSLVTVDPARPPAYRIVALPMTMLGGASLLLLRLTSVVLMASMAVMVHLAVSRVAGRSAGLLAAALVVSLVTVSQSMRIYRTETALYPCVIAMLLCLIAGIDRDRVRPPLWLALGATIGLGALSKVTFLSIAGPVVVAAIGLAWLRVLGAWRVWHIAAAALVGALVAVPMYVRNGRAILASAREAAFFVRHGYDAWTWANIRDWLWMVGAWGIGWGVCFIVIGLSLAAAVVTVRQLSCGRRPALGSPAAVALYLCLAAGVPIIVSQLMLTKTFTTRHISPGYIALAMAACIAAGAAGVLRSRLVWLAAAALLYVQLSFWTDEAIHSRRDAWDWDALYRAVQHEREPLTVVHLGNGTSFNTPFIRAPWVRRDKPLVHHWLWRYEDGPIDWTKIEREIAEADVVVTAPGYVGDPADKQDRDNAHNQAFAERLRADRRFAESEPLALGGPVDHATIAIFTRTPRYAR